ncbi:MAG TPA: hypothetical protein VHX68_10585 [Planctomycetaceae bacterium]|jgi:hypothetical protein|nr:hypothetical protein [Planctomycetaceae bacterium]
MAECKDLELLATGGGTEFSAIYDPSEPAPFCGIYGCLICGLETVSLRGKPLPPQHHHSHLARSRSTRELFGGDEVAIRWQLVVKATRAAKR